MAFRLKVVPTLPQIVKRKHLYNLSKIKIIQGLEKQPHQTCTKVHLIPVQAQHQACTKAHQILVQFQPSLSLWKFQDRNIAQEIVIYFNLPLKMEVGKRFIVTIICKQPPKIREGLLDYRQLTWIIIRQWFHRKNPPPPPRRRELNCEKCIPMGHLKTD